MADPDLELRKGGGGFLSLTLPAFLPFAILFILPKKEGGGGAGGGWISHCFFIPFFFPVTSASLESFCTFS